VASIIKPGLVVDLFSGAGGLSEGFVQAGHDVILATDFNPNMCRTYSYNHQTADMVQADLTLRSEMDELQERIEQRLTGRNLGSLIGGPPCQGFSTAGNRNKADMRNSLVFRMLELVQVLMPDNVVIENVPGLKWMQNGSVLESIVGTLSEAGYSVNLHNLKAEEYGVPQRRRRIFIIGSRNGSNLDTPNGLFAPLIRGKTRADVRSGNESLPLPVSVSEAISDLPPIETGGGDDLIEYCMTWTESDYQRLMRNSLSFDDFIKERSEQG
jgi:DNA (cytosine-5)-methyltransferase 1